MSSDVELLRLPRWMETFRIPGDDLHTDPDQYLSDRMRDYARANLATLQAENERLRAEVAGLSQSLTDALDDIDAVERLAADSNARAERLAEEVESLRRLVQERDTMLGKRPCAGTNADGKPRCLVLAEERARAERLAEALREAYGQVRELCDCYGHVYPEASFVRYEDLLREQEDA